MVRINTNDLLTREPTSGLDAAMALKVMSTLHEIASTGRTVICSIHQVSLFQYNSYC